VNNNASPSFGRRADSFDQQSEEERRGALSYHPESISPVIGPSFLRPVSAAEVSQLMLVLDHNSGSDSPLIGSSFLRSLSAAEVSQQVLFGHNSGSDSPPSVASLLRPISATELSNQIFGDGTPRHDSLWTRGSLFRPISATGRSQQPFFETHENSGFVASQANTSHITQTIHGADKNRKSLRRSLSAPIVPRKSNQSNVRSFSV